MQSRENLTFGLSVSHERGLKKLTNIISHGFELRSAENEICADISVSTAADLPTVEVLETFYPDMTVIEAFALIRQTGEFYILDVPGGGDWYNADGSGQYTPETAGDQR